MENPYEFIHMATVERLADIMEHLYDEDESCNPIYNENERIEAAKEAASRLRMLHNRPEKFNHEAFSC